MLANYAKWYSFTPPQRPNFPPPLTPRSARSSSWRSRSASGWASVEEYMTAPACARCNQVDRMRSLPSTVTGFGGMVHVWVCRRCGIVAVATQGERVAG